MVKGFSSEIMNQHSWFLFIEKEKSVRQIIATILILLLMGWAKFP